VLRGLAERHFGTLPRGTFLYFTVLPRRTLPRRTLPRRPLPRRTLPRRTLVYQCLLLCSRSDAEPVSRSRARTRNPLRSGSVCSPRNALSPWGRPASVSCTLPPLPRGTLALPVFDFAVTTRCRAGLKVARMDPKSIPKRLFELPAEYPVSLEAARECSVRPRSAPSSTRPVARRRGWVRNHV